MEGSPYVSETIADDDGRRQWLFKFLSNSRSPTSGDKSWNADPKKDHPRANDHPDIGFGGRSSQTVQTSGLVNTLHSATCMHVRILAASSFLSKLFLFVSELLAQSTSVLPSRPSPSIVSDGVDRWPRRHKPMSSGRRLKSTSND